MRTISGVCELLAQRRTEGAVQQTITALLDATVRGVDSEYLVIISRSYDAATIIDVLIIGSRNWC